MMQLGESGILYGSKPHKYLEGTSGYWDTAGKMKLAMQQLDLDTKKEHGGVGTVLALKAREHAIKKKYGMYKIRPQMKELVDQLS